ncbi:MAG: hypothetical protein M1812_000300 [Candelaria pacifica]|nr:MAG: hypothetical protein M1812_000300 [Candelaria pacifica]
MELLLMICALILFTFSAVSAYATYFRYQQAAEEVVKKTDVEGETRKSKPEPLDYFHGQNTSTYTPPAASGDYLDTPRSPGYFTMPPTPLSAFFKRKRTGYDSLPGSPGWNAGPRPKSMMDSIDAVVDTVARKAANMLKEEDDGKVWLPSVRDDQYLAPERLTGILINGVGETNGEMQHRRRQQTQRSYSHV